MDFLFFSGFFLALLAGLASLFFLALAWWRWVKSSPRSGALLAGQVFGTASLLWVPAVGVFGLFDSLAEPYQDYVIEGFPFVLGILALVCAFRGQGPSRRSVGLAASLWLLFWLSVVWFTWFFKDVNLH